MVVANLFPMTRKLLARSAFPRELTEFAGWLQAKYYARLPIDLHLRRLESTLARLPGARRGTSHTAPQLEAAFRAKHKPGGALERHLATLRVYQRFLLEQGRLRVVRPKDRFAELCSRYERYLLELRGLSLSSRRQHLWVAADLLTRMLRPGQQLRSLVRADIERFIALRSREVSRHSLQHVIAYLRAFLRYCHDRGLVRAGLDSIDAPRIYRGELPPRALAWKEVQKLLASIDRQSKAGGRDYCILHLIAHYGLRPSEVVALRLDSIDWGAGLLHVRQRKTRSDLVLPLAAQTMELLRRYLKHERERQGSVHPELFLRARCPSGPLERTAIGDLFEKRAREAGLGHLESHVYRLRHSFAMCLLTRGVGVKAIGDVLGHRSLEGTCAYLRLDMAMLRDVALSVPHARPYVEARHA
jgi:site-specific recombinase XerD